MYRFIQWLARLASIVFLLTLATAGILVFSNRPAQASGTLPSSTPSYIQLPAPTNPPAPSIPENMPAPQPSSSPPPELPAPYDYATPVPQSSPVEKDWFADAAFIGDSRTEGLALYSTLKAGGVFAYRGLTVQSACTDAVIRTDGGKCTALEALEQGDYGKIYLSLGVNELGWYNDKRYYDNYAQLIDLVRKAHPQAQIYLQTLIPVTAEKSDSSYINNPQILVYNEIIQSLAEEKQVYLVDTWSAFAGEDGALPKEGSVDGVHLTRTYYEQWLDYLKLHTVPESQ